MASGNRVAQLQRELDSFHLEDNGEREQWSSGSVRDTRRGKGRYDLISPLALTRLARVMEEGAQKYGDRNWEGGIPMSRFLDSTLRHLCQYLCEDDEEDHLGQALWNLHCLVHFDSLRLMGELLPEFDDI